MAPPPPGYSLAWGRLWSTAISGGSRNFNTGGRGAGAVEFRASVLDPPLAMVAYFCYHLTDNCFDLSDLYVFLSDIYVDLSLTYLLEIVLAKYF